MNPPIHSAGLPFYIKPEHPERVLPLPNRSRLESNDHDMLSDLDDLNLEPQVCRLGHYEPV